MRTFGRMCLYGAQVALTIAVMGAFPYALLLFFVAVWAKP